MQKAALVLAFIFSNFFVIAQHEWQVQSILQGNSSIPYYGVSPSGFRMQDQTLSLSIKGGFSYELNDKLRLGIGLLFQNNRYKSSIVTEHPVDSLAYYGVWSVFSNYFNTPYIELSYVPPILDQKLRATVGIRYKYSKSPSWGMSSGSFGHGPDSIGRINWGRSYIGIEHSPWSLHTQIEYEIKRIKRFKASLGLFYTYLQPSSLMVHHLELDGKKYEMAYKLRNDFFGINLGLAFLSKSNTQNQHN
ncbi:hypothetical protein GYB22_07460 [bacterium]|nr:hypothetical protein [bacterium]